MWLYAFLTGTALLIAWTFIVPQQARVLIAELKRQLRLWITWHAGEQSMRAVTHELFQRAVKAGRDPDLVQEILEEDWDIIRNRLGRRITDDILGEPSIWERYG